VLTIIGYATLLIGLLYIAPLLGHATWHAYKGHDSPIDGTGTMRQPIECPLQMRPGVLPVRLQGPGEGP